MKAILRRIWLGCRTMLLSVLSRPLPVTVAIDEIHRVLVIRRDRMGDVVLTSALLPALKKLLPHAEILYWINAPLVPLFAQSSGFTVVGERPEGAFDLVIDPMLDVPLAPARLAASFTSPLTLGFNVAGRGRYFSLPVEPSQADEPFLDSLKRLLAPLGESRGKPAPPELAVTALERGNARELTGFDDNFVLIHPGAFYPSQRWPVAHVAQLIDLLEGEGREVAVVGGIGDEAVMDEIRSHLHRIDHVCFLCGLPLRIVMALMAEAAAVVCNNSGPLHLASALGVPTVSTLGPTNPVIWWPTGEKQHVLVAPGCNHCERGDCSRDCLARIDAAEVVKEIKAIGRIGAASGSTEKSGVKT